MKIVQIGLTSIQVSTKLLKKLKRFLNLEKETIFPFLNTIMLIFTKSIRNGHQNKFPRLLDYYGKKERCNTKE